MWDKSDIILRPIHLEFEEYWTAGFELHDIFPVFQKWTYF